MAILLKVIYELNIIPIKITVVFFFRNGKADPQSHMGLQGTLNSQNNIEEEQSWSTYMSQFQILLWYWHKNRHIGHWNRNENLGIIHGQLIFFNKGAKMIQEGKKSLHHTKYKN